MWLRQMRERSGLLVRGNVDSDGDERREKAMEEELKEVITWIEGKRIEGK